MKRRIVAVILMMVFVVGSVPMAYAHSSQAEHNRDLKYVLFGSKEIKIENRYEEFQAIADAAALTIDQFSPNNTARKMEDKYLELQSTLRTLGAPKLPLEFDGIDLNCQVAPDGKNITASSHRSYTHLGWNYTDYPNQEFWDKRKQILLHTVNWTLFQDNVPLAWVPWLKDVLYEPNEQCEAFCAVVYYVHILGDHIAGDTPDKLNHLAPLIQYTSLSTPGIIVELKEQLRVVFVSQASSWTYAALMEDISALEVKAERNCGIWGKVDTREKCEMNQEYAKELLDILARYLPTLLRNEPFFTGHF